MSYSIEKVEGIGPKYAKILRVHNIQTTADILKHCGDKKSRTKVAKTSGISEKLLLEWTNLADLMRVKGIAEEYADLLEEAGVDTVKELKTRKAESLWEKIKELNQKKKLTKKTPGKKTVENWILHAAKLPPTVSH